MIYRLHSIVLQFPFILSNTFVLVEVDISANLVLRFFLEIAAFSGYFYWGWSIHTGNGRYFWSIGLFLFIAVLWGAFRVPGDPSSGGRVFIAVPGIVRLFIEVSVFAGSVFVIYQSGKENYAYLLGVLVLFHYIVGYRRVLWLLEQ
ncbi:DUF2568 domain-containing protein [Candidatus Bathyarchaeota archaeon]|nr:DUF2568 domain-containing protein [Candidatus Bathyarchaeota archaeon]